MKTNINKLSKIFFISLFVFIASGFFVNTSFASLATGDPTKPGNSKYQLVVDCQGTPGPDGEITPSAMSTNTYNQTDREKECGFSDFMILINRIITLIIFAAGILTVIGLIYSGFKLLTSGGNASALKDAKAMFGKVLLGFVFILGAWAIVKFIFTTLGVDTTYTFLGTSADIHLINKS